MTRLPRSSEQQIGQDQSLTDSATQTDSFEALQGFKSGQKPGRDERWSSEVTKESRLNTVMMMCPGRVVDEEKENLNGTGRSGCSVLRERMSVS